MGFNSLQSAIVAFGGILNTIVPVLIGLAVVIFLWGILKYVISKDDDAKKEARSVMIYGIIAIFVMVAVWGLVNILQNSFLGGVNKSGPDGGYPRAVPWQ